MRTRRVRDGRRRAPKQQRKQITVDLMKRGVSVQFSLSVADRIADCSDGLEPELYEAALDAVAVSYDVYRVDCEGLEESARNIDEIQRLMQGFAGELRKLEEGLRIVSAYVMRMHKKASGERGGVLH